MVTARADALQVVTAAHAEQRTLWQSSLADPPREGDEADDADAETMIDECLRWWTPRTPPLNPDRSEATFQLQVDAGRMGGRVHVSGATWLLLGAGLPVWGDSLVWATCLASPSPYFKPYLHCRSTGVQSLASALPPRRFTGAGTGGAAKSTRMETAWAFASERLAQTAWRLVLLLHPTAGCTEQRWVPRIA